MGNAEGGSKEGEKETTNPTLETFKKFFKPEDQIDSESGETMLARSTYPITIGDVEADKDVVGIIFYTFDIGTVENSVISTNIVVWGKEGLRLERSDVDIKKIGTQIYINTENGMVLNLTLQRTEGGEVKVILNLQTGDSYKEQEV